MVPNFYHISPQHSLREEDEANSRTRVEIIFRISNPSEANFIGSLVRSRFQI